MGFFCADPDSTPRKLVFNRTLALKSAYKPGGGGAKKADRAPRKPRKPQGGGGGGGGGKKPKSAGK